MPRLAALLVALAPLAPAPPGAAAEETVWMVDSRASAVRFETEAAGSTVTGAFTRAEGRGTFSPEAPEASRFELTVPVESLDLGDALINAFATGPGWFDAARHPAIRYRLARLTLLEDGRYEALGDLTIKGTLVILRIPVTLEIEDDRARARGEMRFDRRDFGLTSPPVELVIDIAHEVTVAFDLVARPETETDR